MDGTVPKIFYNFYLNFMNFLIFLNSRGPGSKFQISSGGPDLWSGGGGRPPGPPGSYASDRTTTNIYSKTLVWSQKG